MDMGAILDATAFGRADKPALRYNGETTTYSDLQAQSRQAAQVLKEAGVGAGDTVALMTYNTPGFLVAAFGAWRLGAVVTPINHKLQAVEIDYILGHADVSAFVFDGSFSATVAACEHGCRRFTTAVAADGIPSFDEAVQQAVPGAFDPVEDTAIAEILYTSGTTGRPKGCLHSHRNLIAQALSVAASSSFTERERMLVAMPIWHSSPLNNWVLGTLMMGGTLVLMREYAPRPFLELIEAEKTTSTFCAPIALIAPTQTVDNLSDYDLSSMTRWFYGGGPIGAETAAMLTAAYGSDVFIQVYGMTEAGPLGTFIHDYDGRRKPGSIGRSTTPGVAMRVVKTDGTPARPGEIGEIHFKSQSMMIGYHNDEPATRAAFTEDGWYKTGDIARIDEDGFHYIVDRLKDMIVTGGENVYSKEVEDALSSHPEVLDVAVVGKPHPDWGETVAALIVPAGGKEISAESLAAHLGSRLARYKIPRIYQFVPDLPRTPSGKIQKHILREEIARSVA